MSYLDVVTAFGFFVVVFWSAGGGRAPGRLARREGELGMVCVTHYKWWREMVPTGETLTFFIGLVGEMLHFYIGAFTTQR